MCGVAHTEQFILGNLKYPLESKFIICLDWETSIFLLIEDTLYEMEPKVIQIITLVVALLRVT